MRLWRRPGAGARPKAAPPGRGERKETQKPDYALRSIISGRVGDADSVRVRWVGTLRRLGVGHGPVLDADTRQENQRAVAETPVDLLPTSRRSRPEEPKYPVSGEETDALDTGPSREGNDPRPGTPR